MYKFYFVPTRVQTCPLPLTSPTEVELRLFRNSLCDVNLSPQTSHTHVGRVRLYGCTTLATKAGSRKYSDMIFIICLHNHMLSLATHIMAVAEEERVALLASRYSILSAMLYCVSDLIAQLPRGGCLYRATPIVHGSKVIAYISRTVYTYTYTYTCTAS